MTKVTIEKLGDKNRATMETYATLITRAVKKGNQGEKDEFSRKLRGYLTCMEDNEQINHQEFKVLYLFYVTSGLEYTKA